MFELPECITLTRQMNKVLRGKRIRRGSLGNSPHKFVWYNRKQAEFARLVKGRAVGDAKTRGRWMFVDIKPSYVLVLGECGGKVLYHPPGEGLPKKYHLSFEFDDDSAFSVMTSMWGGMQLFEKGRELSGKYVKDMRTTPDSKRFTYAYFTDLVDSLPAKPVRSVKGLLTQDQLIPGLGNSIAQDIMFHARLSPKHPIHEMTGVQRRKLYNALMKTLKDITGKGGRADEFDLFGEPGGYTRIMDKNAADKPCPRCGATVKKIQYLGGACYFCPKCQE